MAGGYHIFCTKCEQWNYFDSFCDYYNDDFEFDRYCLYCGEEFDIME